MDGEHHDACSAKVMKTEEASSIASFLQADHERLDQLLLSVVQETSELNREKYDEFRRGLLKHIGIEERLLFPWAVKFGSADEKAIATTLRSHHGALAAVLVLEPSLGVINAVKHILAHHNPIEEGLEGFYVSCETLAGNEARSLLAQIKNSPDVPLAIRAQSRQLVAAASRCLVRAGFQPSLLDLSLSDPSPLPAMIRGVSTTIGSPGVSSPAK